MTADLLEREPFLLALDGALREAATGHGRIALVSGEAGIGKTTLIERFLEQYQPTPRTLWSACEALFTPRPLGPLYDIAQQTKAPLRELLDGGANRAALFATLLGELTEGPIPMALVIEDVHWADEATLDLIKFLARRIHRTPTLLILTYRDDELTLDHPLRLVLGDLPARVVTRMRLLPLSETAVLAMAQRAGRSGEGLYLATGGNPFFLSEALASDTPGTPPSISDAVLAQVARRSPEAQNLLELVAVAPTKLEWWVVEAISGASGSALEECLAASILYQEGHAVGYRHELARQAVEDALATARRRTLHAQVLHALIDHGVEQASLARLTHHAAHAEDAALVLRFAPMAAQQASTQGAHREAAAYYLTTLRYADGIEDARRAELLDGLSNEYYLFGHNEEAVQPCEEALAIWRALNQREKAGRDLRRLSRLNWFRGRNVEAARFGLAAVELLETLPPGRELAMAYGNMSHLRMLEDDYTQTQYWGGRAIALAERLHDTETLSYALNNIGVVELNVFHESGREKLERSLALALEHGYEEHVARAYANLASGMLNWLDYAQAERYIRDGIAYCSERDLGSWRHCLRGHQARARLNRGDWEGAGKDASAILRVPWASGTNRGPALLVLSYVRLRRGDPGVYAVLDEERDLALSTGALERVVSVAAARAEWSWLQGDLTQCVAEATEGLQLALKHEATLSLGEVAIWMWRGGALTVAPPGIPEPYALQIAGDWRAAAEIWERIGNPYEQALALTSGDELALREALAIFERLGAAPAAELTRRRLREGGARNVPRGPRLTTQTNPQGLTNRQVEVLLLLAEGLRNSEIARRLSTTPKTVEHHVSAVLAKLDARSRTDAVRAAYQLGLISQTTDAPISK